MQLKWLEDFVALAQARSFSRAAEQRHVTHPAFGRRIRALEQWAGTPLVERGQGPVKLTPAGLSLLEHAERTTQGLAQVRDGLRGAAGQQERLVTLATGRTLARTLVADWLGALQPVLRPVQGEIVVRTRSLAETTVMLENGEVDFMITYHHPLLALRINARQYSARTLARDRLVPVSRCDARRRTSFRLDPPGQDVPWLAYAGSLALGRLLDDHLTNHRDTPPLRRVIECDSADALLEYAIKGLGVAWLPESLVAGPCRTGALCVLGDETLAVDFDVRIYRPKKRLSALAESVWRATPGL